MTGVESALQRIEDKLDTIRSELHATNLSGNESRVRLVSVEDRVDEIETDIKALRTAHDRAMGVLKVLTFPGLLSLVGTIYLALKT